MAETVFKPTFGGVTDKAKAEELAKNVGSHFSFFVVYIDYIQSVMGFEPMSGQRMDKANAEVLARKIRPALAFDPALPNSFPNQFYMSPVQTAVSMRRIHLWCCPQ